MYERISLNVPKRTVFLDRLAIEISHIIGFYSTAASFPILTIGRTAPEKDELVIILTEGHETTIQRRNNQLHITCRPDEDELTKCCWEFAKDFSELTDGFQQAAREAAETSSSYVSATKHALQDATFKRPVTGGLGTLFETGALFLDNNHDFLPDEIDGTIRYSTDWSDFQLIAASSLACRLGMDVTALHYPILSGDREKKYQIVFDQSQAECAVSLNDNVITFSGDGHNLLELMVYFCESFPNLDGIYNWPLFLIELSNAVKGANLDGELSWLEHTAGGNDTLTEAQLSPGYVSRLPQLTERYPDIAFKGFKDNRQVYQKEYQYDWEVDTFKRHALTLFQQAAPGDQLAIKAALSEDSRQLQNLKRWLDEQADIYQCKITVQLVSSYKEGFSWLVDEILPKLQELEDIATIDLSFRPFLPEGQTEWVDEDGSVPTYSLIRDGDETKWLDLPIRFLQELYPADDILAQALHISRDSIRFNAMTESAETTYAIDVRNSDGTRIFSDTWTVLTHEQYYLEAYPKQGLVHPNTGFIHGAINGQPVLQERLVTDLESVWYDFQHHILPDVTDYCLQKLDGAPAAENQPLFSQLKIELHISEPDEKLASRQDLYSSLDALQEDFYFVALDYFRLFGQQYGGVPLDAPGLILPIIHQHSGPPKMQVTLSEPLNKQAVLMSDSSPLVTAFPSATSALTKLSLKDNRMTATVTLDSDADLSGFCDSYCRLLADDFLDAATILNSLDCLEIVSGNRRFSADLPHRPSVQKTVKIEDIDLMPDQLIGYEEYVMIIEQLKHVDGLNVYPIAESYQGRTIHAIELCPNLTGYVSRVKRLSQLPSEIINARHHANEVSGTNGVFLLLKELLTRPEYSKLAEKMNLVLIPFENADGAALHYDLQKEHPEWKFHIARFNALGKDFYYEYFKPDTIHTEALGFSRVWEKWLPDVIVDNHGVPSHEWEQPFSGYTPPAFKGFWLPRSLLYGYFWLIDDERFKQNLIVNKQLEDAIADSINQHKDMVFWNKEWQDRFEKYAHRWLPKLFPADYYKEMIHYNIPFAYEHDHRYPSIRFPWITTVCYTSEVTDETATGDLLALCAKVHAVHGLAVIDKLMMAETHVADGTELSGNSFRIDKTRQRPLVIPTDSKQ